MGEEQYLILHQLFDSVGVIEKGIEKIYHYLLMNKRIDNLKDVCNQFNLTLKRGYKINSVLSDLELVQIYDRPMKIILRTPVIPIWQKIVNNQIEQLKLNLNEKIEYCENSFVNFIENYELREEEVEPEPIEFINHSLNNIEYIYYPFLAQEQVKISHGIRYENILITTLRRESIDTINKKYKKKIINGIQNIAPNIKKLTIQVIFNQDLIQNLLNSREFEIMAKILQEIDFKFHKFNVVITKQNFSNFSLKDDELIQPSFDPSNKLLGAYISRNKDIYQVFMEKFQELFKNGIPINQFLKSNKELSIESLSNFQNFVLCLL
jgi:hypothetical protein